MVLIRLAHAASLPTPEEALKSLSGDTPPSGGGGGSSSRGSMTAISSSVSPTHGGGGVRAALSVVNGGGGAATAAAIAPIISEPETATEELPRVVINSLADMAALAGERREMALQGFLYNNVRLIKFAPGRLELNGGEYANAATIQNLRKFLNEETGETWVIAVSTNKGEPTLKEQLDNDQQALKDQMRDHPLVKSVLDAFPGAAIIDVQDHQIEDVDDTDATDT